MEVEDPANEGGGTADDDVEELDAGMERLLIDFEGPASGNACIGPKPEAVLCDTSVQFYSPRVGGAKVYAPFASWDALRHCSSRMIPQVAFERDRRSES